jgi:threonine/homoserine/homoserine lactone efflux protein
VNDLLPPPQLLWAFVLASAVLAATPGPGVLYILARCLAQGQRSGLASVAGVALGNLGNAVAAALGLAALLALSSLAFTVLKFVGAAYLIWLGVQALCVREQPGAQQALAQPLGRVFRDGVVVALFNPKTTLFFAAFLPQFMQPQGAPLVQSMALGLLFVAIAAASDTLYALLASRIAPRLVRGSGVPRWGRWFAGGVYIALGVFTALTGQRQPK